MFRRKRKKPRPPREFRVADSVWNVAPSEWEPGSSFGPVHQVVADPSGPFRPRRYVGIPGVVIDRPGDRFLYVGKRVDTQALARKLEAGMEDADRYRWRSLRDQ